MATADLAQGRGVPVLIVDCQERRDIADLFALHSTLDRLGNSRHAWLRGKGSALEIYLCIDFIDPVETQILLRFDLPKDGALIEIILQSECFLFQSGKTGDNMANTDGAHKILIETMGSGFEEDWHQLHIDLLAPLFKAKGRPRIERIRLAEERIAQMRSLGSVRIPGNTGDRIHESKQQG